MKNTVQLHKINIVLNIFLILLFFTSFIGLDPILTQFCQDYQTLFILVYLLSLSCIFYTILKSVFRIKKEQFQLKSNSMANTQTLKQLSHDEKYILSLFINKQSTENSLDPKNPSVQLLEAQKIIINTTIIDGVKKIYRIDPKIYKLLRLNPNLLY